MWCSVQTKNVDKGSFQRQAVTPIARHSHRCVTSQLHNGCCKPFQAMFRRMWTLRSEEAYCGCRDSKESSLDLRCHCVSNIAVHDIVISVQDCYVVVSGKSAKGEIKIVDGSCVHCRFIVYKKMKSTFAAVKADEEALKKGIQLRNALSERVKD